MIICKILVELTGIEPVSKQGSNMLSTCLSSPEFFEHWQDRSHQPMPYLLKFRKRIAAYILYLRYFYTSISNRLGERHLRDVSL